LIPPTPPLVGLPAVYIFLRILSISRPSAAGFEISLLKLPSRIAVGQKQSHDIKFPFLYGRAKWGIIGPLHNVQVSSAFDQEPTGFELA
jgi:hypothetical protein